MPSVRDSPGKLKTGLKYCTHHATNATATHAVSVGPVQSFVINPGWCPHLCVISCLFDAGIIWFYLYNR